MELVKMFKDKSGLGSSIYALIFTTIVVYISVIILKALFTVIMIGDIKTSFQEASNMVTTITSYDGYGDIREQIELNTIYDYSEVDDYIIDDLELVKKDGDLYKYDSKGGVAYVLSNFNVDVNDNDVIISSNILFSINIIGNNLDFDHEINVQSELQKLY